MGEEDLAGRAVAAGRGALAPCASEELLAKTTPRPSFFVRLGPRKAQLQSTLGPLGTSLGLGWLLVGLLELAVQGKWGSVTCSPLGRVPPELL